MILIVLFVVFFVLAVIAWAVGRSSPAFYLLCAAVLCLALHVFHLVGALGA